MRKSSWARVVILMLFAVTFGCATSRSEIKLTNPTMTASASSSASARTALIRTIKDERVFEQAPRDPGIPSLGFEGAAQASSEVKARAVGRKRNTYGKALGDILLESGQTVEGVIRDNLSAALQQAGYQVKRDVSEAGQSPLLIDVHIKQFWAWFQPGFWAITLNANIATDLVFSGDTPPTLVSVHAEDSRQIATESAWIEIVDKALQDYRKQVVNKVPSPR